jgi:hypothetical protein
MLAVLASLSPPAGAGGEGRKGRSLGPALSVTLALTFLAGCKLIDQRTFEGAPKAPSAADLAHRDLPPLPLLTVDPSNPDAGWQSQVADAVQAAEARKPDVRFAVVTPIPTSAAQKIQDLYSTNGQADAQAVAAALQSDGIPPDRIAISFQGDPGAPPREVRLYAR